MGSQIYLRGVDFAELAQKYINNTYADMSFNDFGGCSKDAPTKLDALITSTGISDVESCYSTLTGKKYLCIGQKISENGKYVRILPNSFSHRCMNCIREFSGYYWGIPIAKKVLSPGTVLNYPGADSASWKDVYGSNPTVFFTIDIFCHPRCTLRQIRQRKHNSLYQNSEKLFSEIFEDRTGHAFETLVPASDPRFLQIMNGPMDWDTYHNLSVSYTEKPSNMIIYPVLEFIEPDA